MPPDPEELPDRVRQLLFGPVDSFEKLEVLLALHDATGGPLSLGQLAARARIGVEQVERATGELATAEILERVAPDAWRICGDTAAIVGDLATAWTTRRSIVLKTMTDRALGRIKASAARVFADAFRLRRRDKDPGEDDG